jgi:hypothetical protein
VVLLIVLIREIDHHDHLDEDARFPHSELVPGIDQEVRLLNADAGSSLMMIWHMTVVNYTQS